MSYVRSSACSNAASKPIIWARLRTPLMVYATEHAVKQTNCFYESCGNTMTEICPIHISLDTSNNALESPVRNFFLSPFYSCPRYYAVQNRPQEAGLLHEQLGNHDNPYPNQFECYPLIDKRQGWYYSDEIEKVGTQI